MARLIEILKSVPADAKVNMALDFEMFTKVESGKSRATTIRLYSWSKHCITFGRSQKPENDFNTNNIKDIDSVFAIRPTGGGMVFHSPEDLTYCLVTPVENHFLPKGIEAGCAKMHEIIASMLSEIDIKASIKKGSLNKTRESFEKICFSTPTKYELSTNKGLKIAGSAQKKGKKAIMIQGQIPNHTSYSIWEEHVKNKAIINNSNSSSIYHETKKEFSFEELSNLFIKNLEKLN